MLYMELLLNDSCASEIWSNSGNKGRCHFHLKFRSGGGQWGDKGKGEEEVERGEEG